jgi:tetratricopeptide (TPR) repeat protein
MLVLFFTINLLSTVYADGQLHVIDSLYQLLDGQQGDQRIETMINLSEAYRLVSYDKSLKTAQDAVSYAETEGFQRLKAKVLKSMGISAYQSDDYELALSYYKQAIKAYENSGDQLGKATVLNNTGLVYKQLGDNEKALELYQQAYDIQFKMSDISAYATTNINIAGIYYQRGELNKAFDAYYQAQLLFGELKDSLRYAQVTNNLANVYWQWNQNEKALQLLDEAKMIYQRFNATADLSRIFYTQGLIYAYDYADYNKALDRFNRSLVLREELGDPLGTANVLINIANIWMEQERFEEAFSFYQRGLRIHETIGHTDGILMAYYYMGIANQKLNRFDESNVWLTKCEEKSKEVNSRLYEDLILEARMKNASALGNYKGFLAYFDEFVIARDSLADAYSNLQTADAQNRYQLKEYESQLASLAKEYDRLQTRFLSYQYTFYTILGLLFLLFVYGLIKFVLIRFRRSIHNKQQKNPENFPLSEK